MSLHDDVADVLAEDLRQCEADRHDLMAVLRALAFHSGAKDCAHETARRRAIRLMESIEDRMIGGEVDG